MSFHNVVLTLAACLMLAGCATKPVAPPKVIYQTIEKYVPVPAELSKDCEIPMPKEMTVEEAIRVAKERAYALKKCNEDKRSIRNLPLVK